MTCLYPSNAPTGAYRKGCRCARCRDGKGAKDRERSRPSPCNRCGGPKPIGGWFCNDCHRLNLVDRVADKVVIDGNGCWIFMGTKNRGGYGQVSSHRDHKSIVAHRVMYEHFVGPVPQGLQLDHLCNTPACVNPDHLEAVTGSQNMQRIYLRRAWESWWGQPYRGVL